MATQQKKSTTTTKKATTARQWRSKKPEPTTLPSGNKASIRVASMEFFLQAGFIPNSLKSVVQNSIKEIVSKEDPKEAERMNAQVLEVLEDDAAMNELIAMYDKIAIHCFIEPKLSAVPMEEDEDGNTVRGDDGHPIPLDIDERDQDLLYVDEIDFQDKVFVFNVAVGGTKDVESFRRQQEQGVESVRAGAEVEDETE